MVRLLLALALLLVGPVADAATAKYTFTVGSMQINQLCSTTSIIAVNGQLPGPSIEVNEGDAVEVKVINNSPYNVTIHWHGVLQLMTPWADGPSMVSQCPIQPSGSYTYRFSVPGQEGTLWWHAHSSFLRATVYGAFIVRPRAGNAYPFPAPDMEVPIVLGNRCCALLYCMSRPPLGIGRRPCQPRVRAYLVGVDRKKNLTLLVSGCGQASGGTGMWSTSRATPSWPASSLPSPTLSRLTA
jgi:hypothetical protein